MEWPLVRLDSLYNIARGGSPRPIKKFITDAPEGINWVKIGDATVSGKFIYETKQKIIPEGIQRSRFVKEGDFLLSNSMSFGRPYIMGTTGCIHDGWLVLNPKDESIDQDFLYYILGSPFVFKQFDSLAAGSTVRNLNIDLVSGVKIPRLPIPEQKRIVAILDQAFADIEQARAKTEQNLKNARELFESYLQQVFSQRGEGWVEETLDNLVTDDCALSYGIVQPGDDFTNGLPVVRPTDMKKELINQDGLKLIDPSKSEGYTRTRLKGGELLVCVRGTTGITSIACKSLAGANVTRGIVPVRFEQKKVSHRFGYYQFISPLVQDQIKAATYGAALMQINIRDFRKIKITVPPLEIQKLIEQKLDKVKPDLLRVEEVYASKLAAFDELKKSILQKAFNGELEIKSCA